MHCSCVDLCLQIYFLCLSQGWVVCVSICLFVCLFVCLSVCLLVCLGWFEGNPQVKSPFLTHNYPRGSNTEEQLQATTQS